MDVIFTALSKIIQKASGERSRKLELTFLHKFKQPLKGYK